MKHAVRIGLVFLLCSFASAQSAVPGTFSAQGTQPSAMAAGPLLTPPSVSYGSGLTPPTVVSGQTMLVSAPQSNMAEPSAVQQRVYAGYVTPVNGYVPMPTAGFMPVAPAGNVNAANVARARFDYIVAPSGSSDFGEASGTRVGDTSLGQLAASLRKGPPPTQRTFTNDDIARMNGVSGNNYQMPGASTTQPQYPQQQTQPQLQPHSSVNGTPLPSGAKPSPFRPKAAQGAQQTASDQ